MNRVLRLGLVALVALNLLFVHLTGAVGRDWLIALVVFTVSAPLTARYRDSRAWCGIWNAGVLITFAALVRDAATTGPRQLLEDGMTLAAFCQVHLLNVIRDERRADLLFFNSFLIAVVTSFFCQDITFSIAFAAWVIVFVTTLSVAQETRDVPPWATLRDAAGRAGAVLLGTMIVFAVWPRDFRRPGLVDDSMFLTGLGDATQVGFSEKIDLGRSSHVAISERIALTATLESGRREDVPTHWRGATLDAYDGRGWISLPASGRAASVETNWDHPRAGHWVAHDGKPSAVLSVTSEDSSCRRLFAPLETLELEVETTGAGDFENVIPALDGTFVRLPSGIRAPTWRLHLGETRAVARDVERRRLARYLHIDRDDPHLVPPVTFDLLREATRGLPTDTADEVIAVRCRDLLATRFGYLAPGRQGAAGDLAEFLSGCAPAHCEYFATALALMLRLRDIPCRVATGYLAHEWKPDGRTLVIRDSDAHAWVEVFDQKRGWYALDATPATAGDGDGFSAWMDAVGTWLTDAWNSVTTFDAERRAALLRFVVALPGAALAASLHHPVSATFIGGLIAVLVVWRRSRRRVDRAIHDYRLCLARLRVERRPEETPRELLERIRRDGGLAADEFERLELATVAHERARFECPVRPAAIERDDRLRSGDEVPTC